MQRWVKINRKTMELGMTWISWILNIKYELGKREPNSAGEMVKEDYRLPFPQDWLRVPATDAEAMVSQNQAI
jgi:hypothetical protein